jgi:hypothetical protein
MDWCAVLVYSAACAYSDNWQDSDMSITDKTPIEKTRKVETLYSSVSTVEGNPDRME